jgi:hypothetical protein
MMSHFPRTTAAVIHRQWRWVVLVFALVILLQDASGLPFRSRLDLDARRWAEAGEGVFVYSKKSLREWRDHDFPANAFVVVNGLRASFRPINEMSGLRAGEIACKITPKGVYLAAGDETALRRGAIAAEVVLPWMVSGRLRLCAWLLIFLMIFWRPLVRAGTVVIRIFKSKCSVSLLIATWRRSPVCLLAALFFIPLALMILFIIYPYPVAPAWASWLNHPRLRNLTLGGIQAPVKKAELSWGALRSGDLAKNAASHFDHGFPGREWMVRWHNEMTWRVFGEVHDRADVAIGENDSLFEKQYLRNHLISRRIEPEHLRRLLDDLATLQRHYDTVGKPMLLVITPCKVSICPEDVPRTWQKRMQPGPFMKDIFLREARARGIQVVDAQAVVLEASRSPAQPAPLFPRGGTHWTQYGALLGANEMLRHLATEVRGLEPMQIATMSIRDVPPTWDGTDATQGLETDRDLVDLVSFIHPWRFPSPEVFPVVSAIAVEERPSTVVVGGSFCWLMMHLMNRAALFSRMDFHFYHSISSWRFQGGVLKRLEQSAGKPDFARDVLPASCLILEINEAAVDEGRHLRHFLDDALRHLHSSDGAAPKEK